VATHNHFVLDRGGKVFNRSAPVIKLPAGSTEADHLALLGLLNSSTACFWMKQVFHNKGEGGGTRVEAGHSALGDEAWKSHFEVTGTGLQKFPIPDEKPLDLATDLDRLAREHQAHLPAQLAASFPLSRADLDAHRREAESLLGRMIALQEELDWRCYRLYGVIDEDLCFGSLTSGFGLLQTSTSPQTPLPPGEGLLGGDSDLRESDGLRSQPPLPPSPSGRGVGGEGGGEGGAGGEGKEFANQPSTHRPVPAVLLAHARELRASQTDAESLLWRLFRDRRFGGYKFRRQHPVSPYIVDFYCHEKRLAIELDGSQHLELAPKDALRSQALEKQGIRVLRFWNNQVLAETEAVLGVIWDALDGGFYATGSQSNTGFHANPLNPHPNPFSPHPNPSPGGRGAFEGGGFGGRGAWFEIGLGERAFEIVMARQMDRGELATTWFERHRSKPVTEIPDHWPEEYRRLVERRIALIESDRNIGLIERPEYKRRWNQEPWENQEKRALRAWLLDRLEQDRYWPEARLQSARTLGSQAETDVEFMQVAELYVSHAGFDVFALVAELVESESVPLLPVLRYKPSGLRKREVWERTWELQRREDAIDALVAAQFSRMADESDQEYQKRLESEQRKRKKAELGDIAAPPKYRSEDFIHNVYWRLRGPLDVPKERFVSYPYCSRENDASLVLGWAGWDPLQQARALAGYYTEMVEYEGWQAERLRPVLAGLAELLPWLKQWHNDIDPMFNERMGDFFETFLGSELQKHGLTRQDLATWVPAGPPRRGRRAKS
ncbi:MAG: BREX-2 system adenine-specific DNA-methyltransferase PglX, partial [Gammaproteobacteria bacterium]